MVLQFTPVIRQRFRLLHRINGYIVVLLAVIANIGAIMIAREAFGGTLATQSWIGATFILTTVGLGLAIYNVKRLQIDQHRAWMLRTWFYVRHLFHNTHLHAASSLTSTTVRLHHYPPHHHDYLSTNCFRRRRLLDRPKLRQAPRCDRRCATTRFTIPILHIVDRRNQSPSRYGCQSRFRRLSRAAHVCHEHYLRYGRLAGTGTPCHRS